MNEELQELKCDCGFILKYYAYHCHHCDQYIIVCPKCEEMGLDVLTGKIGVLKDD